MVIFQKNLKCCWKSAETNILHILNWGKKKKVHRLSKSVKVAVIVLINTITGQGSL